MRDANRTAVLGGGGHMMIDDGDKFAISGVASPPYPLERASLTRGADSYSGAPHSLPANPPQIHLRPLPVAPLTRPVHARIPVIPFQGCLVREAEGPGIPSNK
jgi:hypothetical protein